ncbi:ubiquitinspecific protease [Nannochloropsis oceanica]
MHIQSLFTREVHPSLRLHQKKALEGLSLQDCFDAYTTEEALSDEVYCSRCKVHQAGTRRKEELWRLPPCLIVHLKRFQYTQHTRRKLNARVRFPLDGLDLSPYVASAAAAQRERKKKAGRAVNDRDKGGDQCPSSLPPSSPSNTAAAATGVATCSFLPSSSSSSQYTLYAIIHHVGAMQAGHYVATVRVEQGGRWYCFNDSRVEEVPAEELVNPSAYILFYIRKDMAHLSFAEFYPMLDRLGGMESKEGREGADGKEGGGQDRNMNMTEEEMDQFLRRRDAPSKCSVM